MIVMVPMEYEDREAILAAWESAAMPLGTALDTRLLDILRAYDHAEAAVFFARGQKPPLPGSRRT